MNKRSRTSRALVLCIQFGMVSRLRRPSIMQSTKRGDVDTFCTCIRLSVCTVCLVSVARWPKDCCKLMYLFVSIRCALPDSSLDAFTNNSLGCLSV